MKSIILCFLVLSVSVWTNAMSPTRPVLETKEDDGFFLKKSEGVSVLNATSTKMDAEGQQPQPNPQACLLCSYPCQNFCCPVPPKVDHCLFYQGRCYCVYQ